MYCSWLGQKYLVVFSPFSRKQLMNQQSLVRASTFWPSSPSSSSLSSSRSHSCGVLRSSTHTHTHTQCAHLILSNYVKVTMQIETQQYGGRTFILIETFSCVSHSQLLAENQYSIFLLAYVCTQLHMQTLFVPEVVTY